MERLPSREGGADAVRLDTAAAQDRVGKGGLLHRFWALRGDRSPAWATGPGVGDRSLAWWVPSPAPPLFPVHAVTVPPRHGAATTHQLAGRPPHS